jgi:hypothetical protein
VGRALGSHFEIGGMPYVYSLMGKPAAALYVPVKWDPFPAQWPVRWILHAGPVVYGGAVNGGGAVAGTGFAFEIGRYVEAYVSASAVIPYVELLSAGAGVRVKPTERLSVGLNGIVAIPGVLGAELSASVVLGK